MPERTRTQREGVFAGENRSTMGVRGVECRHRDRVRHRDGVGGGERRDRGE